MWQAAAAAVETDQRSRTALSRRPARFFVTHESDSCETDLRLEEDRVKSLFLLNIDNVLPSCSFSFFIPPLSLFFVMTWVLKRSCRKLQRSWIQRTREPEEHVSLCSNYTTDIVAVRYYNGVGRGIPTIGGNPTNPRESEMIFLMVHRTVEVNECFSCRSVILNAALSINCITGSFVQLSHQG